jgi:hypothetical protein
MNCSLQLIRRVVTELTIGGTLAARLAVGAVRWWAARQTIPRGRVHADPRFDALVVSMTPRGGWCCLETTDLTDKRRTNGQEPGR